MIVFGKATNSNIPNILFLTRLTMMGDQFSVLKNVGGERKKQTVKWVEPINQGNREIICPLQTNQKIPKSRVKVTNLGNLK